MIAAKTPPASFHDAWFIPRGQALQDLADDVIAMVEGGDRRPKRRDAAVKRRMVLANITANLASLVLSANYKPGRRLAISTAKDKPTRYDRRDWPQGIVSEALNAMVKADLIIRHRHVAHHLQTTIEPTSCFRDALRRHQVRLADIGRKTGAETVWLMARTGEEGWADNPNPKERRDYKDSRDTPTSRKQMEEINAFLNAANVTYRGESQGPIFLRRSFLMRHPSQPRQPRQSLARNFMLNGRLFGGFWQNLLNSP